METLLRSFCCHIRHLRASLTSGQHVPTVDVAMIKLRRIEHADEKPLLKPVLEEKSERSDDEHELIANVFIGFALPLAKSGVEHFESSGLCSPHLGASF